MKNRNAKIVVVGVLATLLVTAGIFYTFDKKIKAIEQDFELTTTVSPEIKPLIQQGPLDHDTLETDLDAWDPENFNSYLYFDQHFFESEDDRYYYRYVNDINEGLGTDIYLTEPGLDGIIAARTEAEIVATYSGGGDAYRMDVELFFIKLPERTIVKHMYILGGSPPSSISVGQSAGVGKYPSSRQIVKEIKEALGR